MTQDQINSLIALEAILDAERDIILSGDFDDLAHISTEKEHILHRLKGIDRNLSSLQRVLSKANRNERLLNAMKSGIESARRILHDVSNPQKDLNTYSEDGNSVMILGPRLNTMEKKA